MEMVDKQFLRFIERSKAFDNTAKLKLILFLSRQKPSTYIQLKITDNTHDKHTFENFLRKNKKLFQASKAKGFEQIKGVIGNKVIWGFDGIWHGYDLFHDEAFESAFNTYVRFVKEQRHDEADELGSQLYGYPSCCMKAFKEGHNLKKLGKKYSYYSYYKMLHDFDKKFPFITHTPCSLKCRETIKINNANKKTVKQLTPLFYKEFSSKKTYRVPAIVDTENDIGAWKKKNAHDYLLITRQPISGHFYLLSWLTKKTYPRGTMLDVSITVQYDFATIKVNQEIGKLTGLHHERKFTRL